MNPILDCAAFVGVDWADQEHAFYVLPTDGGRVSRGALKQQPEAIAEWVAQLRPQFGGRPVAIFLDQSRTVDVQRATPQVGGTASGPGTSAPAAVEGDLSVGVAVIPGRSARGRMPGLSGQIPHAEGIAADLAPTGGPMAASTSPHGSPSTPTAICSVRSPAQAWHWPRDWPPPSAPTATKSSTPGKCGSTAASLRSHAAAARLRRCRPVGHAPSSCARRSTNSLAAPRSSRPGPRRIWRCVGPPASPTKSSSGPWHANGNASSSVAGRTASPTMNNDISRGFAPPARTSSASYPHTERL